MRTMKATVASLFVLVALGGGMQLSAVPSVSVAGHIAAPVAGHVPARKAVTVWQPKVETIPQFLSSIGA